ncbi:unnamed protein product [Adineta steineri]|uniref:LamG-like jellyroll fold domain-containing protein n=1 Tax=Adineta steineri TaxID=433720 RepID=A0A815A3A4_9BILA|nr:unnamed protein product [Adineta steineri]CAF1250588.1 unnamed protein product [Adineta steineri]
MVDNKKRVFWHFTFKDILTILCSAAIPIALAIYTAIGSEQQKQQDEKKQNFNLEQSRELRQQTLYDEFINNIFKLDNYGYLKEKKNPWAFANAYYRAADRQWDTIRKADVIQFLKEKQLIGRNNCTNGCKTTNLVDIIRLNELNLDNIRLASQTGVLNKLNLQCISFDQVSMSNAIFSFASLNGASFDGGRLDKVKFDSSSLLCASFNGVNLSEADFGNSNLTGAQFSNSDMSGAKLTEDQIKQASFHNVTMPNGKKSKATPSTTIKEPITQTTTIIKTKKAKTASPSSTTTTTTTTTTTSSSTSSTTTTGLCIQVTYPYDAHSYWALENNVADSISNLSGTAVNAPIYTNSGVNGGYNLRLISSSNQYITIPTYQSFVSTSFTVEMWIYPTSLNSGTSYGLFSQYESLTQDHNLYLILSGENLKMGFWDDDVTSETALLINTCYHVAFVYDNSSQTQIIYLNGVQDTNRSSAGPYLGASGAIHIGNYYDGSNHTFDGAIDEVTLYMNARSASDILSDATLSTWHSFDCGISYDSGPNRIKGTAYNVILASGRVGQGLSYTSSSSYYQLYGFPLLGTSNHPYSISLWIQRTSTGAGTVVYVSSQTGGGGWCIDFMGFSSSGQIIGASYDGVIRDVVGPILSTNVWVHVATTFSTTNGVRLYVNGSLIGSTGAIIYAASGTLNTVTLGNPLRTGCVKKSIAPGTFYGYLDEFRLYSRELTAADVTALANP